MFMLCKAMIQCSCLPFLAISFLIPFEKVLSHYQIISLVLRVFVQWRLHDKRVVNKIICSCKNFLNLHLFTPSEIPNNLKIKCECASTTYCAELELHNWN